MILGDDSAAMNELSSEMHEMVEFAAQSEDADLVLDLRAMGNNSNSTYFDAFFDATQRCLVSKGFICEHDRRHDVIPHLAAATGWQQALGMLKNCTANGYAPPFISIRDLSRKLKSPVCLMYHYLLTQHSLLFFVQLARQTKQLKGTLKR